jgi:long-chain fatty acid transport protein
MAHIAQNIWILLTSVVSNRMKRDVLVSNKQDQPQKNRTKNCKFKQGVKTMKRSLSILCMTGIFILTASPLMAGGIANKQNFSTEYLRTSSRNSAIDSADAAVFNPAGVMKMEDGLYISAGAFYAFKDYYNASGGMRYESDEPSIVPYLIGLYKKDKWAAFGAFTVPAGGGKVVYDSGSATTLGYGAQLMAGVNYMLSMSMPAADYYDSISRQRLEAESIYYGFTAGGAYKFNDLFSIALGARFIKGTKEAQASMTIAASPSSPGYGMPDTTFNIDYEEEADGLGGFIGVSITPQGPFNIGLRYETKTSLDFETSVNRDDTGMLTNGAKEIEDLPGLIGLGIGYRVNPALKIDTSFTYYLEEDADRQNARFQDVGNGYDLAIAFEYTFNPKLKGSLGYMLTNISIAPDNMLPEAPELDANTLCAGLVYSYSPDLRLNFALMRNDYHSEIRSDGIELGKDVTSLAFGLQYRF